MNVSNFDAIYQPLILVSYEYNYDHINLHICYLVRLQYNLHSMLNTPCVFKYYHIACMLFLHFSTCMHGCINQF